MPAMPLSPAARAVVRGEDCASEPREELAGKPVAGKPVACPDPRRVRDLVVAEHAFVWRSLVRLGIGRADAEDAAQQVFVVLARRIDDVEPGAERAFLYGVALRVASRARRTMARRREVAEEQAPERADPGARADERLDLARAKALLESILAAMPLELRSVFTLFELEQLTMSEIAELLELPPGTVASRLRRAREVFAEHRKRVEVRMRTDGALRDFVAGKTENGTGREAK